MTQETKAVFENAEVKIHLVETLPVHFLMQFQNSIRQTKPVKVILRENQRRNIGVQNDLLAKAIGWKTQIKLNLIDATVGLGRDLEHFLGLGCQVLGIEQNPYLFKALNLAFPEVTFIQGNSVDQFSDAKFKTHFSNEVVDVVYIDPMFPLKKKSAAVGKESLLLQWLTESLPDNADLDLFNSAVKSMAKRIVVKRPLKTKPFESKKRKLSHSYSGKAIRYDVYI